MYKNICSLIILAFLFANCSTERLGIGQINRTLDFSVKQYGLMNGVMKDRDGLLPRSLDKNGHLMTEDSRWWTSGFYPGSIWYLYEYSHDAELKDMARKITARVEREKWTTTTHDLGFMINCSFGNGLRLTHDPAYNEVMTTAAKSLCTRFNPKIGLLKSWESLRQYKYPVIIDNMMNLELLMWAFKHTGDSSFYKIAVTHADNTIKNHYRPDYSSYHVVCYDSLTGLPIAKVTAQGYADESAWSRGQVWGLYGFTMMYRETKLPRYLEQARHIADYLLNHPNLPKDKVPYWDFNAPNIPDAKRDASAAAIMASALIELSGIVGGTSGNEYVKVAERQLLTLSSPDYLAKLGTNGNFILMHGVGHMPAGSEIDVPLTYGDYYFIEALMRYKRSQLDDIKVSH